MNHLVSVLSFPRLLTLAALLGGGATGCQPPLIPNTDVEDSEENRRIIEFCEVYRKSVERRDVPRLLKLTHPSYYEDGGTADTSDDMDRDQLAEYLRDKFSDTRGIRYEIRYRRIGEGRNKTVFVDYTYSASYKVKAEAGMVWRRSVEDNRLELLPEEDTYKILSGM